VERKTHPARALVLGLGALLGVILFRRRFARREERIDVYYEDGSMVSVSEGSADAARLLPLARDVLDAARS
jgi:hypothetical protein